MTEAEKIFDTINNKDDFERARDNLASQGLRTSGREEIIFHIGDGSSVGFYGPQFDYSLRKTKRSLNIYQGAKWVNGKLFEDE